MWLIRGMANGYTAPKGRATTRRDERAARSGRVPPMLEWIILVIVVVAVIVVAVVFTVGGDSTPHNGARDRPAAAVAPTR